MCAILGIGAPIIGCGSSPSTTNTPSTQSFNTNAGPVLIIGAGAAGMSAGYLLGQRGIEYQILEASSVVGGRMRVNESFTDFPIPLGGEWIHSQVSILEEAVNNSSVSITTQTQGYSPSDMGGVWNGSSFETYTIGAYSDLKFVGSSWFNFFEEYILPTVQNNILFDSVVSNINYSGNSVTVTTAAGPIYTGSRVIVAVPLKILQEGDITFTPALPANKTNAISQTLVWPGLKAFFEFSGEFYPTFISFTDTDGSNGERIYYDAAYAQTSDRNILGFFTVGTAADPYINMTADELRDNLLAELDTIFDGAASANFMQFLHQNWQQQPYAQAAYVQDFEGSGRMTTLGQPVNNIMYFAGDAYFDGSDWSSVHVAVRSARRAVDAFT